MANGGKRLTMAILGTTGDQRRRRSVRLEEVCPAAMRAAALWPRLDRRALARCGCDPVCIANFVARRTRMSAKAIELLLTRP
jgi:hypothetical protein